MKKYAMIVAATAITLGASATDLLHVDALQRAFGAPQVSVGHNLETRRAVATEADAAPMKTHSRSNAMAPATKSKGLSVDGARKIRRANVTESDASLLFESFESMTHDGTRLPRGWQRVDAISAGTPESDSWKGYAKVYAEYFMLPMPAEGDIMLMMPYTDDYKDELLVSPEVTITADDYLFGYYWYTIPYYMYVIDREHINFNEGTFINREMLFNVQVLIREAGTEEWTVIDDFGEKFKDYEYEELAWLDFDCMQRELIDLKDYAGKTVQFAFRYYGADGNSFFLDAVSVDKTPIEVSYGPDLSRLFFGYSADEYISWMPASIEFYPVNHPTTWYNTSPVTKNIDFEWTYFNLDDDGFFTEIKDSNPDYLEVTFRPDYTQEAALVNNLYYMPELTGRLANGGMGTYTYWTDFLQAGGTTEYDLGVEAGGYVKFMATNFDIAHEGYGYHAEGDDTLGFFAEPIFGHSVNTDAWWHHYSFPNGSADGIEVGEVYVDGFANLYMPHSSAPLVVNGVSAWAFGTIYPEAEFTASVYSMTEDGRLIEEPLATKTIKGADVLRVDSGYIQKYLIMSFEFDEPVVFSPEGTGYGYIVMITGYHDDNIEFFAPMQSMVPNENEWALSFYKYHTPYYHDLTSEMSYVAEFKDDYGRELYTSFAIGLDAHYPWLQLADDQPIVIDADNNTFTLQGYYDAEEYTVEAPDWLTLKLEGRYLTDVTVAPTRKSGLDRVASITFKAPGVSLTVNVTIAGEKGEADVNHDGYVDIADAQRVLNIMSGSFTPGFGEHTGDVNADGEVNIADVQRVLNAMSGN